MQTFLPFPNFRQSAAVLDRARLGKQRVETLQLLKALHGATSAWANHPAAKMWKGYECSLLRYQVAVCEEWTSRGYKDTCLEKSRELHRYMNCARSKEMPPWFGEDAFHLAHRSNLLRKKPEHYGLLEGFQGIPDDLEYIWPGRSE